MGYKEGEEKMRKLIWGIIGIIIYIGVVITMLSAKWIDIVGGLVAFILLGIVSGSIIFIQRHLKQYPIAEIEKEAKSGLTPIQAEAIIRRKLFHEGMLVREVIEKKPVVKGKSSEKISPTRLFYFHFVDKFDRKERIAILNLQQDMKLELDESGKPKDLKEFDKSLAHLTEFSIIALPKSKEDIDAILEDMARFKPEIEEITVQEPTGTIRTIKRTTPEYKKAELAEERKQL